MTSRASGPGRARRTTVEAAPEEKREESAPTVSDESEELAELRRQLAELKAQLGSGPAASADLASPSLGEGDKILIHFVEDGLTAQGVSWYRGQEVEFVVGSPAWNDSLDRNGESWILRSEENQMDRYGRVFFRRGPWIGKKTYTAGEWEKLEGAPPPSDTELQKADELERNRRRSAPLLPTTAN